MHALATVPEAAPPGVVTVTGAAAPARAARELAAARVEVGRLHRSPGLVGCPAPAPLSGGEQARRPRVRAIYGRDALAAAPGTRALRRAQHAGEEVRVVARTPLDLVLVDRRVALLPAGDAVVVVGRSRLLDALVETFETTWDRGAAAAAAAGASGMPDDEEREILTLIAAGLKDQAIARAVGMSQRTLRRRIARLLAELGAETRFQAGMLAERRGWL